MSDNNIDFSSLASQAKEMINTPADSGASTSTVPIQATPVAGQQPATSVTPPSTPVDGSQAPSVQTPGQAPAEPTFQVDFGNGRVETLTQTQLRELHNSGLRQADYTRKTQELAAQRQRFEQLEQQAQYIQTLASNPVLLAQEVQRQTLASQPPPPIDPNQPVTMGQLQQLTQGIQQQYQTVTQDAQRYVEDRLQVANYAERINAELSKISTAHPVLKSLPEFEDVLRFRVAKLEPQNLDEAIAAFNTVAKDMATGITSTFTAQQQQAAVARQSMVASAAEPPGGVAVQQQQPSYTLKGKREVDWNALREAAKNF